MQKEKLGFSLTLSSDLRKVNSTLDKTAKMRYDTVCTVYLGLGCLSSYLFVCLFGGWTKCQDRHSLAGIRSHTNRRDKYMVAISILIIVSCFCFFYYCNLFMQLCNFVTRQLLTQTNKT